VIAPAKAIGMPAHAAAPMLGKLGPGSCDGGHGAQAVARHGGARPLYLNPLKRAIDFICGTALTACPLRKITYGQ
jgi:hypothetical protein